MLKGTVGAACAVLCLLLSGMPAAGQQTLTIGAQTPPSALDPHYHNTTNNSMMKMQIFERLFELDNQAVPQPRLAESMRALDDLTWEVKLRQGVRFHDGTPFEADDIGYTFARIPTVPNSPALYTPAVRTISAIEIVDPATIRIRTHEPNPLMFFDMAAPVILSRRIHGPNPATSDFTSGRLAIGTGPYSNPGINEPLRLALATMDPERRQVLTQQAARALPEDKGVLPVIFLRNTWAGRRDRVVYDASPVNYTSAVRARPPN